MAKKKDPGDEQAQPEANGKRAGGRTIAGWKKEAFEDLRNGSDEEIAAEINRRAKFSGHDYVCTPEMVRKWRGAGAKRDKGAAAAAARGAAGRPVKDEGEAIWIMKELVRLLGKEAVKGLVDRL